MKRMIGHDAGSYVFDASEKTIRFICDCDEILAQEQLLTITNTTRGIMIYCFADSSLGGTLAGNVLTLTYNTTAMSDDDALQIYVDIPETESSRDGSLVQLLRRMINAIIYPPWLDRTANAIRNQVQSGTITTVTTVATLSNISTIDSIQARLLMIGMSINAWANTQRRTIS